MRELFNRRLLAVLAAVNVLFFGGWIAREELSRRGDTVKFPVEGYDPRDLLSGHYVQFRLVAEREAQAFARPTDGPASFCVEELEGRMHVMSPRETPADCDRFITSVAPASGRVDFGVSRFYVDERKAPRVATVDASPHSYLIATLDDQGRIHPVDLVVNGINLRRDF